MDQMKISRRGLVASAGIAGAGLKTSTALADLHTAARLVGNIAPGAARHDWFDGRLLAVSASGDVRALCGVRGSGITHLSATADGWRRRYRADGRYYDPLTGAPLTRMTNPITGATVHPAAFTIETEGAVPPAEALREDGGFISLEEKAQLEIAGVTGRSIVVRSARLSDFHNAELSAVPDTGSWTFIAPWLPWLEMGDALGHCQFACRRGGADRDLIHRYV